MFVDIKKVRILPYTLTRNKALASSHLQSEKPGALIEYHFSDGSLGVGDCSPFPGLGDDPLTIQIDKLKKKQHTCILKQSYLCAKNFSQGKTIDWVVENEKKLLEKVLSKEKCGDVDLIKNHSQIFLNDPSLERLIKQQCLLGVTRFKFKLNKENLLTGTNRLVDLFEIFKSKNCLLRLDFNLTLNSTEFESWALSLPDDVISIIEYIEDPFPFDFKKWLSLQRKLKIKFSLDRELVNTDCYGFLDCVDFLTLKPALIDWNELAEKGLLKGKKIIFSHYMDHPLGYDYAWWNAKKAKQEGYLILPCGLNPVLASQERETSISYGEHSEVHF